MESFLISTGTILIFFISAYGWGGLATRYIYVNPTNSIAYDISVGLAIWVFIGGILNALGLAYPIALDSIITLGIFLFGLLSVKLWQKEKDSNKQKLSKKSSFLTGEVRSSKILTDAIPLIIIISASALLIITILPATAFNHHDDLYRYLPRLYRMLQSGKLGGTPFDYIGIDTLGAQPFLQSFVAAHFPIQYLNGFDAVFCFLLAGLLLNDIGRRVELSWFVRSGAIFAFIVINPQYVNISALYSGSLMILALIYSSLLLYDCFENAEIKEMFWASMSFAFILSTLAALKMTFMPFVVSYVVLFFALIVLLTKQRKSIILIGSTTVAMSGLFLVPWFWSVYSKMAYIFHSLINKISYSNVPQEQTATSSSVLSDLFSAKKLFYGGYASDYTFIVLCILAAALWAGYLLIKKKETANNGSFIVVISAGISVLIAYLVNGYFASTFAVGIRYSCPIIIAAFPAILLLFTGRSEIKQTEFFSNKIKAKQFAVLVALGVCIGFFLTGWYGRINQLFDLRTMLSYPIKERYINYINHVLSDDEQKTVLSMQEKTKENTTMLAWSDASVHLNFERNSIFTVGSPGIIMRTGDNPKKDLADVDMLSSFLRSVGVRYVMWGYGEVPKAPYHGTSELQQGLEALSKKKRVIHYDGKRMIIDINSQ